KNAHLAEVVAQIDIDDIVLETDSPYLAPVPFRGKRNESSYVLNIAEKLSEIKNISLKEVAERTTETATQLFNL
ncbi:MAG: TatD family hydrolase, partial [Candidatus Onthomorpha sp.]|nr:TatD family hydrolase [Candidatus Onthomorpha sp.]